MKMGVPKDLVWQAGNSRRGHWFTTHKVAVNMAMTRERQHSVTGNSRESGKGTSYKRKVIER